MSRRRRVGLGVLAVVVVLVLVLFFRASRHPWPELVLDSDLERQGQQVFRDDTFGDEKFWTDTARLHEVVDREIQPIEALLLGVKVDLDRLNLLSFILHNPLGTSGTEELLRQNAVVGLRGTFDENGKLVRIGITCALCGARAHLVRRRLRQLSRRRKQHRQQRWRPSRPIGNWHGPGIRPAHQHEGVAYHAAPRPAPPSALLPLRPGREPHGRG